MHLDQGLGACGRKENRRIVRGMRKASLVPMLLLLSIATSAQTVATLPDGKT